MTIEGVLYITVFFSFISVGVSDILPCPLRAAENSENFVLECRGISPGEQVSWQRVKSGTTTDAGYCDPLPSPCLSKLPDLFALSRPSANVSRLTISSVDRSLFGEANFTCTTFASSSETGSSSCTMDVVYEAEVSNCSVVTVRSGNAWLVNASCFIDKVFSSSGVYTCHLLQRTEAGEEIFVANSTFTPTLSNINGTLYGSGECVLTTPLQPRPSSYTVLVYPGATRAFAGKLSPVLPATPPTLTCSPNEGQYVAENEDIECACSTSDLGEPPGKLLGYRGNVLLVNGSLGDNLLTFPVQTLSRHDNGAVFRCVVLTDWAEAAEQEVVTNLSVRVAYGPEKIEVSDPGTFDVHPSDLATVTFTCNVTSASPAVTLTWQGPCAGHADSTCTFAPSIADDREPVTCVAHNKFTGVTKVASRILLLNYPPQDPPVISGYDGSPLRPGQSLLLSCLVAGGLPKVTALTFFCQGQGQEVLGQSGTVNLTVEAGNHGDECFCTARWKIPAWYTQRASVKLIVLQPPEIMSLTVNDTGGVVTLNESADDTLLLSCDARGVPSPSLRLLRDGKELAAKEEGQFTAQRSTRLTARLPARCESSATYTCTTGDADQPLRADVTLDVLCAPRLARGTQKLLTPEIHLLNVTSLLFDLESNPPPSTFTFRSLGTESAINSTGQLVAPNVFSVICSKTAMTSRHACVINVTTVMEAGEGVYVLDIGNDAGQGHLKFSVSRGTGRAEEAGSARDTDSSQLLIVATVLGVLVLSLGVVVVVCWVRNRRRAKPGGVYDSTTLKQDTDGFDLKADYGHLTPQPRAPSNVYELSTGGVYDRTTLNQDTDETDLKTDDGYLTPQPRASSNVYKRTPGGVYDRITLNQDTDGSDLGTDDGYLTPQPRASSNVYKRTPGPAEHRPRPCGDATSGTTESVYVEID